MRIILEVDPEEVEWASGTYARAHKETVEAWGTPQSWDEVDYQLIGYFGNTRISFYDEDDEWEAIKYVMGNRRMG